MDKDQMIVALQAKVAELEKLISEIKYEKSSGVYEKQSEPVAWMSCGVLFYFESYAEKMAQENNEAVIPLYTTPQTKQLSDEEILEIWKRHSHYGAVISVFDFVRELEAKVRGQ